LKQRRWTAAQASGDFRSRTGAFPDDRFMANTLFDENYGGAYGNCHIALGSSYSNTYAGNARRLSGNLKDNLGFNDSALHWDFVNTEKKRVTAILADGSRVVVYENGEFSR
jgi:aminopeptidase